VAAAVKQRPQKRSLFKRECNRDQRQLFVHLRLIAGAVMGSDFFSELGAGCAVQLNAPRMAMPGNEIFADTVRIIVDVYSI
jgi:hypothetical protein